jgi:hypothetical protein
MFRRLALQYVKGYREGGNARLGVHRDHERPTFVADEFRSMIDRLPRLATDLPDLKRYLLSARRRRWSIQRFPAGRIQFGLRPTIPQSSGRSRRRDHTIVVSKMLCTSHCMDRPRSPRPAARPCAARFARRSTAAGRMKR